MLKYVKRTKNADFSNISLKELKKILKSNVDIPLLEERYKTIVSISKIVNERMKGNFYEFIKNITSDTQLFDIIISNFESFKYEINYDGKIIYFYKLAQLLTSDVLHIREELEQTKNSLKSKEYKFKLSNLYLYIKLIMISILKRTDELEKTLVVKGYLE